MKLLIFEPEHEEEMRRPSVERGEVHSLPRPPENHEGTDDLVRMAVQGVQKRNAVSGGAGHDVLALDRKSTRLNSSHGYISYAVFCLKKKKKHNNYQLQRDRL